MRVGEGAGKRQREKGRQKEGKIEGEAVTHREGEVQKDETDRERERLRDIYI